MRRGKRLFPGGDECLTILNRLDAALIRANRAANPCSATGEGWIAEEAFATGLLCFPFFPMIRLPLCAAPPSHRAIRTLSPA